jgi:hypothetical protein|tara:strand:- start:34 stop:267 length:234 start_codon:yes stop_codon:yes gene_type:complete
MNQSEYNEFYPQLAQKGITLAETRTTLTRKVGGEMTPDPILPDGSNCYWYQDWVKRNPYDTYADYIEKINDGLNGGF